MKKTTQQIIVILLLGLATIMAGVFTWRAGQLASTAAYDDRQSVGQTIKQEQQNLEIGLKTMSDAAAYVRYTADYAEADALDTTAGALSDEGADSAADLLSEDANLRRTTATERAARTGVFGANSVYADLAEPTSDPRSFDFDEHREEVASAVTSGIDSPGRLDPDYWAAEADDLRSNVRNLKIVALVLVISVVWYTVAQMTDRTRTRILAAAGGFIIFTATTIVGFATVWS